MQMGYPLTIFDLGAPPAERVKNYRLRKVIEIEKVYSILFDNKL